MTLTLIASLALSGLYLLVFCTREPGLLKLAVKVGSIALLALWAAQQGAPMLILLALGLSALGDAFLAGDPKKWLLAGMAAFFAAHVAYIPLFWGATDATRPLFILALQVILTFGAAVFVRSLLPWIDKPMRLPVLAYGVVILLMGNAALRLDPALLLATIGALMFITSDAILSLELFRMAVDHRLRPVTARLVWALYYGGQALIAAAFISALTF